MKKHSKQSGLQPPRFPSHKNPYFYLTLFATFMMSFVIYLRTLAPTVTFEDSGELIAAAANLGIPHEPGYPLFTMLGHIFTYLPFGNIAYRVNVMSAFFSALGGLFIAWAFVLWAEYVFQKTMISLSKSLLYASAFSTGILGTLSGEAWEQAVITEVYGLHTFFVGLLIWLTALWARQFDEEGKRRLYYLICFSSGLALTNHPTSILLFPVLLGFVVLTDWKFVFRLEMIWKGTLFILAGLIPFLYLPLASLRDPLPDWGDPETWTNFWRVVMRHQYQLGDTQSWAKFIPELKAYFSLSGEQWNISFLIFLVVGVGYIIKNHRSFFYWILLFLFFVGPLTTFLTNFPVTGGLPFVNAENRALVSVFYIPSHLLIALVTGFGIFGLFNFLLNSWPDKMRVVLIVILPLGLCFQNFKNLNLSEYYFAEDYVENIFSVADSNSLVLVNWDPHSFPLIYYQSVEHRREDIFVVDQELLRRSWYIKALRKHHPRNMDGIKRETDEFLASIVPFERGDPYDGNYIQAKYLAMINALIDQFDRAGRNVYLTYDPPQGVAGSYFKESLIAAVKLRKDMKSLTAIHESSLKTERLLDKNIPLDRMARFFMSYYGRLYFARGFVVEKAISPEAALPYYEKAAAYLQNEPLSLKQALDAAMRIKAKK